MTDEYTEFRFTSEEISTLHAALRHAEEDAVHPDGTAQFNNLRSELVVQSEHHNPMKGTESERFEGDGDD